MGERFSSLGEQHVIGLSKPAIHDSIEHGVDGAVEQVRLEKNMYST